MCNIAVNHSRRDSQRKDTVHLMDLIITRLWPFLLIMWKACVSFWVHVTQRPLLGDLHHFRNLNWKVKLNKLVLCCDASKLHFGGSQFESLCDHHLYRPSFFFFIYFLILSWRMLDYYTSNYATIAVFHILSNLFFTSTTISRCATRCTVNWTKWIKKNECLYCRTQSH
jgi:hypothetical protein